MIEIREIVATPALAETSWSVAISGPSGEALNLQSTRLLKTASVAKLFLLVEVAVELEDGQIEPGTLVERDRVGKVGDSGLWQYLQVGALTVEDLATLVGCVSDNWATNALLDLVGLDTVRSQSLRLGSGGSRLLDIVRDVRSSEDVETLSRGCASDWVDFVSSLSRGEVISAEVSGRVLNWISKSLDLSMVAGAFGLDPLAHSTADRGLAVWSKTGTDEGVRADVGHVRGPRGQASYAVICNWDAGASDPRDAVLEAMRDIGVLIREEFTG